MSNQPPAATHRSLTGFVTKLVGDAATYGFINEEIFFPQTNVSGGPASVGDQVFAECEYSAHLPIKWNATSVKILNKAGGQQQQQQPPPNNSRSDHHHQQHQQQSDLMNQQQQQQFNQPGPVAVTYQQHRQQRQQRQMLDVKQPDSNVKQPSHQLNTDLTAKLLEHTNNPAGEYFDPGQARLFPQQQLEGSIQPFHDQTPMGPPNFAYTSQLGSAFVQNQFVPAPFLAQQPPPMLPQQQQPPPPQHLLTNNQPTHNQNNQRHNKSNMGGGGGGSGGGGGGGRFNNQGEKNDRQNNRRNQNRNDNKFDRPRSGDRDGGAHNNNRQQQQQQQKSNTGGRDRSAGRNTRRDDPPARPSPPAHSSARSTTSMSSDRGIKSSRRHYEVQNIPKTRIMTNMNAYNMKQRCPSSVHVPSDLKDIIVNKYFRLDIKNTPKPIRYTIEPTKSENKIKEEDEKSKAGASSGSSEGVKKEAEGIEGDETSTEQAADEPTITQEVKSEQEIKPQELPTPPSSKSDVRLNHKYGVKVILLSLPELETIYHSVFGQNLDSFNHDSKSSHSRLDEVISMLCNKGQNNGHSLIGGKFDPILDGFLEGHTNEYERHGRQPDLIATCKRVVQEQTSLDLANCRGWTLLSTFIYNNKTDYFSQKASIEYSFIYMPQIWTMLSDKFDKNIQDQEASNTPVKEKAEAVAPSTDSHLVESSKTSAMEVDETTESAAPDASEQTEEATLDKDESNNNAPSHSITNESMALINPDNLAELKVCDLKDELSKRDIKFDSRAKKADLIALLHECLQPTQPTTAPESGDTEEASATTTLEKNETNENNGAAVPEEQSAVEPPTQRQLEEGEVETEEHSEESPDADCEATTEVGAKNKRKGPEAGVEEPESCKKPCTATNSTVKEKRVELIQESFKVRARDEQQQLSLVSLYEVAQVSRHDQFELSVASNILKESLVQHLSEYILTTLVEDNKQKLSTSASSSSLVSNSNSSSQETNSDTNNNNNNNNNNITSKSNFKNPTATTTATATPETKVGLKEFPIDRYINLAFSYFDSTHMGYVYFEDLNKLFNNTGLAISKRALISLVGDGEKFNYKTLPELSPKLQPTYLYEFPKQFSQLPTLAGGAAAAALDGDQKNLTTSASGNMIEYKGVLYDVAQLVQQVREAETLRVSMVDRFNYAIENSDRQAEEIHVLEVSQKSLAKAIKAQNDEICDLKRERDSIKKKFDSVRKGVKGTITSLSDLIKED